MDDRQLYRQSRLHVPLSSGAKVRPHDDSVPRFDQAASAELIRKSSAHERGMLSHLFPSIQTRLLVLVLLVVFPKSLAPFLLFVVVIQSDGVVL